MGVFEGHVISMEGLQWNLLQRSLLPLSSSCKMRVLINLYTVALCCFFSISALAAPTIRDLPCNGETSLCNRKYSNVSFIGAHDSAFVGPLPTQNQDLSVTAQLNGGLRFLQ